MCITSNAEPHNTQHTQYCGAGYGMKDVVYLLVSSTDESLLTSPGGERQLLGHYHAALTARLRQLGKGDAAAAYGERGSVYSWAGLCVCVWCQAHCTYP